MMGKTHQVVGVTVTASTLIAFGYTPFDTPLPFSAGLLIGWLASVLPDIDGHPDGGDPAIRRILGIGNHQTKRETFKDGTKLLKEISKFLRGKGSFTAVISAGVSFVGTLFLRAVAVLVNIFAASIGHRGVTHWAITWILLSILCSLINPIIGIAFFAGYGSHLLADMATRSGLPLFAPIFNNSLHILPKKLRLRTGSYQESLFLFVWLALSALLFGWLAYNSTPSLPSLPSLPIP